MPETRVYKLIHGVRYRDNLLYCNDPSNFMWKRIDTMPRPVLTKADFVRRYALGEFGNASPTWDNIHQWAVRDKGLLPENQLFHLRNRTPGGATYYNVSPQDIEDIWPKLSHQSNWYISAMAPHHLTILQGEVTREVWGLLLTYTPIKSPMREALAEKSETMRGLNAKMLIEQNFDTPSLDNLIRLLDDYPDHVIEFSTFSRAWGTIPSRNTVFWEVRKY